MVRLSFAIALAFCTLNTIVQAANPVFGVYTTPSCDSCLDETYLSCPGDYQTRDYAKCMCAGDGSTNVVSCLSLCDPGLNEPANVVTTFYGYCVTFFKEMCPDAAEYLDDDRFNKECSPDAIAAGGIGESDSSSDSGSESSDSASVTDNLASTNPTATANAAGSTEEARVQPTSGATAVPISALAVIAGLGMLLMFNVDL